MTTTTGPQAARGKPRETGNCFNRECPSRAVLAHVTGRWGGLVLAALCEGGIVRFSELRARIDGISEKMLAQTLRELERDGVVLRTSRPVVPPHVDYRLTPMGTDIATHVAALVRRVEEHHRDFVVAQRAHDAHGTSAEA